MRRPIVTIPPANCSAFVPPGMRAPVAGTPFPAGDTAREWMAFGVSEGAARVLANQRAQDALAIVAACEKREGEIAKAVKR